jgi:hypothetical protein
VQRILLSSWTGGVQKSKKRENIIYSWSGIPAQSETEQTANIRRQKGKTFSTDACDAFKDIMLTKQNLTGTRHQFTARRISG